jgi:hypothetical protein
MQVLRRWENHSRPAPLLLPPFSANCLSIPSAKAFDQLV